MSDNDSGLNRRNGPAEIPFELQLALEEVEWADDRAAAFITAIWQTAQLDLNESPPPNPNWHQQSRRQNQEAAPSDAQERALNISDSDSSPEPQNAPRRRRYQLTRRELRLINSALLETRIGERARDILADYFGDRFRSVPVYGNALREPVQAPEDALADNPLDEPGLGPSSSNRPSYSHDVIVARNRDRGQREFQARMQAIRVQIAERNEQRVLARVAASRRAAFEEHRDSHEREHLLAELALRAQEFAENDPEAYDEWNRHRELTLLATDSPARQYQMLLWYIRGPEGSIHDESRQVPTHLLRQIVRIERWSTHSARLEWRSHRAEVEEQSRPSMPVNDNNWAGSPSYEPVGFESGEDGFGFENYSPRHTDPTEAELQLANVSANFATRRIRLLHATSATEFAILLARMHSFIIQALETFDHLEFIGEDNPQLQEDFPQRVADERSLLTDFQEEDMVYEGTNGTFRDFLEESDASDIGEDFPDGMPTAIENAREMNEDAEVEDSEEGEEGDGEHEEQSAEQGESQEEGQEDHGEVPDLEDKDIYS
jgi:hypothetical protein